MKENTTAVCKYRANVHDLQVSLKVLAKLHQVRSLASFAGGYGKLQRKHKKVRDIALENCFDIAQIRGESPDFLVKQGVAIGAACRFVGHTKLWLKWRAQGNT